MPIVGTSALSSRLDLGDVWTPAVLVASDESGTLTNTATVTAAVVNPSGTSSAPTVLNTAAGLYGAPVALDVAGRWVARLTVAGMGLVPFAADVLDVVLASGMPVTADLADYLGGSAATYEDAEIASALAAERAAQAAVCRIPATYPLDLREALLRRAMRNLAMRALPLAVVQGDSEQGSSTVLPGRDPEVFRLERPWRRHPIG